MPSDAVQNAIRQYFARTQSAMSPDPQVSAEALSPARIETDRILNYDSPGLVDLSTGIPAMVASYRMGAAGLPPVMRQVAGVASMFPGSPTALMAELNVTDKKNWPRYILQGRKLI